MALSQPHQARKYSCNTTTLDGAPLFILVTLRRVVHYNSLTDVNDWNPHIEHIRLWATYFNRNVPVSMIHCRMTFATSIGVVEVSI